MAGNSSTIGSGIVTGLAALCVALRFYVRIRIKVGVGWDDWLILLGLLLTLLAGALVIYGTSVDPNAEDLIEDAIDSRTTTTFDTTPHTLYLQLSFIGSILYFSVVTAIKYSILFMYYRIFSIDSSFRRQSWTLGLVIFCFWLASTIATLVNCRPLKYSWIGLSLEEYCFNYNVFWMATGAVEVVIDTAILMLPIRMVLRLQLSRTTKASVILVFLLGGFVIISGLLRVIYGFASGGSRIPSYSGANLWSAIHIGTAIICACLPPIRPLITFPKSIPSAFSSIRRRYYNSRGRQSRSEGGSRSSLTNDRENYDSEALELPVLPELPASHSFYMDDMSIRRDRSSYTAIPTP